MFTGRLSLLAGVWVLLISSMAPAMIVPFGFNHELLIEVTIPAWTASRPNPMWTVTPLFGCTTTIGFSGVNQCSPVYERIVCEETNCLLPNIQDPLGNPVVTQDFSDDCFICFDTPECCDILLPSPDDGFSEIETSTCAITGLSDVTLTVDHTLLAANLPPLSQNLAFQGQRTSNFAFDRLGAPQGPVPLDMSMDMASVLLAMDDYDDPRADVSQQWTLSIVSPQLGALFQGGINVTDQGVMVGGDFPAGVLQMTPDGVEATDVEIDVQVIVPPDMDHVDVQVTLAYEGRLDWDLDGNGLSDIVETELDPDLDEDRTGILDVCEVLGFISFAVQEATLSLDAIGDLLVSNIGSSGLDGVCIDIGAAEGVSLTLDGLPEDSFDGPQLSCVAVVCQTTPSGPENAAACMVFDALPGNRLRMTPNFDAFGTHELEVFVNGGNYFDGSDVGFVEVENPGGTLPWPSSVTARLIGNPPRVGYRLEFDTEVLVVGDSIQATDEPIHFVPNFLGSPPEISPLKAMEVLGQNISNGFIIAEATPDTAAACPVFFVRGDFNGDDGLGLPDMIGLLSHLFQSGLPPFLVAAGDVNGDGVMGLVDVIFGLGHMFSNGTPPPAPYPNPGCPE